MKDNIKKFNEFLFVSGMVYGALFDEEIKRQLLDLGMSESDIDNGLAFFRALHKATYHDNQK